MKVQTISGDRLVQLLAAYDLGAHKTRVTVAEVLTHAQQPFGSDVLGKRFEMTPDEVQLVEGMMEAQYVN